MGWLDKDGFVPVTKQNTMIVKRRLCRIWNRVLLTKIRKRQAAIKLKSCPPRLRYL